MLGKQSTKTEALANPFDTKSNGSTWAIVMAGGTGSRMRAAIHHWMGECRPKQYCTFVGTRSMLQHTIDRANAIAGPQQIVTVIGRNQHHFFHEAIEREYEGLLLTQPIDRGTTSTVLHALAYIMDRDPEATVVLLPSDHFVRPEHLFLQAVQRACANVEMTPDSITLLAAPPSGPETDYGWIVPSEDTVDPDCPEDSQAPRRVRGFHEKPSREKAEELYRTGSLWNTMVAVSKARLLWTITKQLVPETWGAFENFRQVLRGSNGLQLGVEERMLVLTGLYAQLHHSDFSTEVLQSATRSSLVMPLHNVEWSDWGRPERVIKSLSRLESGPSYFRIPRKVLQESPHWSPLATSPWIDFSEGMTGAHP